ncbi:MAG: EscU/YscU/HrcU family type III secretion system export apparatus switch protein [Pseudomonadota bacterium]|nr:EscU/YscU/HrcU family type III secretion system export apparatus switch protein [Pseudomonadota bacterium]
MADPNSQDRQLPATPRKLRKAREDGQVARSQHWGHFVAIAGGGTLLIAVAPTLVDWLQQTLVQGLLFDGKALRTPDFMGERLQMMTIRMLWVVLPAGFAMMAAGVGAALAIGGWNFTLKPLSPKFGKLNPLTGLPAMLSTDKLLDALKASALALVLGAIGALWFKAHYEEFAGLLALPLPAAIHQGASSMISGLVFLVLALALFAAVDVPLQKFRHAQRLKMSHQEVKQENKEQEGNQEIKAKVRARMREMVRRRMLAAVPKADLVVMNPTHYAVALKYDDQKMAAPRVVAKGADLLALKIRDLAQDARVPVLQAPVLARALYAHAEIDREIPAALFGAVAQVLAYVYQLRAALAGSRVPMPGALPELHVPAELDPHHTSVAGLEDFEP